MANFSVNGPGIIHYPPLASHLNDLRFAINGTGAPGIYTSSHTPDELYGTYNWCNMPHTRPREYHVPPKEYVLKYVEVIHRHHKRTPYQSNVFPTGEDILWDCPNEGPIYYVQKGDDSEEVMPVKWSAYTDPHNPFTVTVAFNDSNCQFPQITSGGLDDSHQHGVDLAGVYRNKLQFLPEKADPKKVTFRVTNNVITSQVAGGLIKGMFPRDPYQQVLIQNSDFDSLEPTYSCSAASTILSAYEGSGTEWANHLEEAASVYARLDAVSGIRTDDSTGFHQSFDHYYDNLSAKQCHGKKLPCNLNDTSICVDQQLADTVYRLGNWEYSYLWRDAANSTLYSATHYGAWLLELKAHLEEKVKGKLSTIYRHNVAHDGSIAPLLGALQSATGFWPGMGTEIIFELYERRGEFFIRVLLGGQPMKTSTPMGTLSMVPWSTFHRYLTQLVGSSPSELYNFCNA